MWEDQPGIFTCSPWGRGGPTNLSELANSASYCRSSRTLLRQSQVGKLREVIDENRHSVP